MSFFDFFKKGSPSKGASRPSASASDARDRLKVIIARERAGSGGPDFLQLMHAELLDVVRKYIDVDPSAITVHMDKNGDCEMLEVNVVLPDRKESNDGNSNTAPVKPKGRVKKNRRR